jgi:hypothetical protein
MREGKDDKDLKDPKDSKDEDTPTSFSCRP